MDDIKKFLKTANYELIEKIPTFLKHFCVYNLQDGLLICGMNVPKVLPNSLEANVTNEWDVTGSPLEFSYAHNSMNDSVLNTSVPWLLEEENFICIPPQKARELLNLYVKHCLKECSNRQQLWVLCAARTVFLGVQVKDGWWSRTVITQLGRKAMELHSFQITELLDKHKNTARMSSEQKESMQLECTYKIYENLNTKVSFKMTWQHLVLEPPINAKTKVFIQSEVCSAEDLWRQLHQINELLQILESAHLSSSHIKLIGDGDVLNVVSDPSYLNCPSWSEGGVNINKAMEGGAALDAADKLWMVLRDCKNHEELEQCFKVVFNNIISGEIKPYIRHNNTSPVAYIIQEMMTGLRVSVPTFEGTTSIKFLIEMGISKLVNDYMHIFLSPSVVTAEKLKNDFNFSRRCSANEANDWLKWLAHTHAALEILLLAEKYLSLSTVQLSPLALTALDTFQKNYNFEDLLEKRQLVFEASIATECIQSILPRFFSDWSLAVKSENQRRRVLSMFYFNIRSIYPSGIRYAVPDYSDCDDTTYEFTEMVCCSDKML